MRLILSLTCCLAVASAGIIGYPPWSSYSYHPGYLGSPFFPRTFAPPYPGSYSYHWSLGPSSYSPSLFPGGVVFTTIPIIPLPLPPSDDDKKDKDDKKPKDKKNRKGGKGGKGGKGKGKDSKEDTTDSPKDDDEEDDEKSEDNKKSEVEDLSE